MDPSERLQPRAEAECSSGVANGTTGRSCGGCIVTVLALAAALELYMMPTAGSPGPGRPATTATPLVPSAPRAASAENETTLAQPGAVSLAQCVEAELPYELTIGTEPVLLCH